MVCKGGFQNLQELESVVMPVEMSATVMKELGAKWPVSFYNYISTHPELVTKRRKQGLYRHLTMARFHHKVGCFWMSLMMI